LEAESFGPNPPSGEPSALQKPSAGLAWYSVREEEEDGGRIKTRDRKQGG